MEGKLAEGAVPASGLRNGRTRETIPREIWIDYRLNARFGGSAFFINQHDLEAGTAGAETIALLKLTGNEHQLRADLHGDDRSVFWTHLRFARDAILSIWPVNEAPRVPLASEAPSSPPTEKEATTPPQSGDKKTLAAEALLRLHPDGYPRRAPQKPMQVAVEAKILEMTGLKMEISSTTLKNARAAAYQRKKKETVKSK